MKNFTVDIKTLDDIVITSPKGYLNNIMGEKLEEKCNECINSGIKKIVLDFAEVEFINSIGISLLLSIVEKQKEYDGTLCFSSMKDQHKEIFELLGLTKYVLIFESQEEAMKHLRELVLK